LQDIFGIRLNSRKTEIAKHDTDGRKTHS
jgi:hypothetical protein